MKILNLFAGIGGNRTLWGDKHEITAVEENQKIAGIYFKRFPNDKVIVGDAYDYLLKHFKEFDLIWASPPCTTHTCLVAPAVAQGRGHLPDLRLYSIIIFLSNFCKTKYIIENVVPYYEPLIPNTSRVGRHLIWANFYIPPKTKGFKQFFTHGGKSIHIKHNEMAAFHEIDYELIKKYSFGMRKDKILRNCVDKEVGKYILDCLTKPKQISLLEFGGASAD